MNRRTQKKISLNGMFVRNQIDGTGNWFCLLRIKEGDFISVTLKNSVWRK